MRRVPVEAQDREPLLSLRITRGKDEDLPAAASAQGWLNFVVAAALDEVRAVHDRPAPGKQYSAILAARLGKPQPLLGVSVEFVPKTERKDTHPRVEGRVHFERPDPNSRLINLILDQRTRGQSGVESQVTATFHARLGADGAPVSPFSLRHLSSVRKGSGLQGALIGERHQLEFGRLLDPEDLRRHDVAFALGALSAARNVVAENPENYRSEGIARVQFHMSESGSPDSLVMLPRE